MPPSSSPEKTSKANRLSAAEEAKYRRKHRELLKRIKDVEEEYEQLTAKLLRSRQRVCRLRVERSLLFEKLESVYKGDLGDPALFGDHLCPVPEEEEEVKPPKSSNPGSANPVHNTGERNSPIPGCFAGKAGKARGRPPPDPNAPKRPANAFMVFCSMTRKEEQRKGPDSQSQSDTTKLLAQRWNGMSREEQKKFYDLYEKDKERYLLEMNAYQAQKGETGSAIAAASDASQQQDLEPKPSPPGEGEGQEHNSLPGESDHGSQRPDICEQADLHHGDMHDGVTMED